MRRFRKAKAFLASLLASVAAAGPARAAITVFSDPADATYFSTNTQLQSAVSSLGARTSGDPGSRTIVYVFRLPRSDTGIPQVQNARFSMTFADPSSRSPALGIPTTYDIDFYGLPARGAPNPEESDNYFDASDPQTLLANGHGADTLIKASLLPRGTAFPVGEFVTGYDAGTKMVKYLNDQYGSDGAGTGTYIFLRLNPNKSVLGEDTGGYVSMGEAATGRPYLTLTFVPEPSLTMAATVLLAATTLPRRRPRHPAR